MITEATAAEILSQACPIDAVFGAENQSKYLSLNGLNGAYRRGKYDR